MNKKIISLFALLSSVLLYFMAVSAQTADVPGGARELAAIYNDAGFKKAIRAYKKGADKGDTQAVLNLAVILKDLGYYDQAIKVLSRSLAQSAGDSRVLALLGRLYYLDSRYEQAIAVLKKLLAAHPPHLEAKINLGLCLEEQKNFEEAKKYYEEAIMQNKNDVMARLSLADLYYRRERLNEAANEYKAVSLLDASIISAQKMLGEIFFRMDKAEDALRMYQKIRTVDPKDPLAQHRINILTMRLGEEYFAKERVKQQQLRQQRLIRVSPFPEIKNMVKVRVGIVRNEPAIEFRCSSAFEVQAKTSQAQILSGEAGVNYKISRDGPGQMVITIGECESVIVGEPLLIRPLSKEGTVTVFDVRFGRDNFWAGQQDRSYRGEIEILLDKDNGLKAINTVSLEEYLYSVVPSEMPSTWPREALKAQAVAARTEAMAKLGRHRDENFDFCPEVHCQVYSGVEKENSASSSAVDETRGITMTFEDKPIDAIYSSNCGGHTQSNVFGAGQDIAYLKGRLDASEIKGLAFPLAPWELERWLREPPAGILCDLKENSSGSSFRWVRIYSSEEINNMLRQFADFKEVEKIIILKRQPSGHISAVKIVGKDTSYVLEKELQIRNAFGSLRSSMFKIEVKYSADKKPEKFIFYGGGWGHGVGMCQSGALGMANNGKSYKEILTHYYSGIKLKTIY